MTNFVRTITSGNRFWRALRRAQGPPPDPGMNVGILIAHSREADRERLRVFAERLAADVRPELEDAAGIPWRFHQLEMTALDTDAPRRPSDFLDEASLRMAEGPYDLLVVVTDLALISRRRRSEAGIASATTRIIALSTRKLTTTPRGERLRELSSPAVRWNAARLLLHLTGHVGGLRRHADGRSVMAPFRFQPQRTGITPFSPPERAILRRRSDELPERALEDGNLLETFIFSALMALRHPADVLRPLIRNRAPLLPLSLPSLATAAVAPSFLLIFSAEIWDVGLSMTNATATLFASISIVAASLYLVKVQSLFLPRKEKRVLTEHLAVANVVIFLSILLACLGLFVLVGGLMLIIEYYIFPPDLMHTWPTLNRPEVTGWDKIRLAAFIATTGVTTGALAGGLESRTVIQHLALFEDEP